MMAPAQVKRYHLWLFVSVLFGGIALGMLIYCIIDLFVLLRFRGDLSPDYDVIFFDVMCVLMPTFSGASSIILLYPKEQARLRCVRGEGDFRVTDIDAEGIPSVMPITITFHLARAYSLWPWGIVAVMVGPIGVGAIITRSLVALYFCLSLIGIYVLLMGLLQRWQWRRLDVTSEGLYLRHWLRAKFIPWHEGRLFAIIWESRRGEPSIYELASERTIIRWPTADHMIVSCSVDVEDMDRVLAFIAQQTALPLYRLG